jgi:hypothetical protein
MSIENEYEGKVVLVTGGAGCIGTNKLFFYKETFTKERNKRNKGKERYAIKNGSR